MAWFSELYEYTKLSELNGLNGNSKSIFSMLKEGERTNNKTLTKLLVRKTDSLNYICDCIGKAVKKGYLLQNIYNGILIEYGL